MTRIVPLLVLFALSQYGNASWVESCTFKGEVVELSPARWYSFKRTGSLKVSEAKKTAGDMGYSDCTDYIGQNRLFKFYKKDHSLEIGQVITVRWFHASGPSGQSNEWKITDNKALKADAK